MMKVKVRLYGTLRQRFPDYRHSKGIEVEIPNGATIEDLLGILEVSESRGAVVIADGRAMRRSDGVRCEVPVDIFQAVGGG